jgi:hypothetical protein
MSMRRSSILVLAVAALYAQACSSSSSSGTGGATGSGGTAGHGTGGTTATGGVTGTGGHGTGGTTATGGVTGTGGATDAGADVPRDTAADMSVADTATDGGPFAALCPGTPAAPGRNVNTPSMTPAEFCSIYLATCVGGTVMPDGGYTTQTDCVNGYTALFTEATKACRSYHVCNAAVYGTAIVATHCGHAVGIGLCPNTPADAGGQ